jgi:hypothetical protein
MGRSFLSIDPMLMGNPGKSVTGRVIALDFHFSGKRVNQDLSRFPTQSGASPGNCSKASAFAGTQRGMRESHGPRSFNT